MTLADHLSSLGLALRKTFKSRKVTVFKPMDIKASHVYYPCNDAEAGTVIMSALLSKQPFLATRTQPGMWEIYTVDDWYHIQDHQKPDIIINEEEEVFDG